MKKYNLEAPPRQRTSVPIQGIDVATPDDTVADGKCSALNNLRFKNGAWRPVSPYTFSNDVSSTYTVVYSHPATPMDTYIVRNNSSSDYYYGLLDLNATYNPFKSIGTFSTEQKISHFGNILIFASKDGYTSYYLYEDGAYKNFQIPSYCKTLQIINEDYQTYKATRYFEEDNYKYHEYDPINPPTGSNVTEYWIPIANLTQGYSLLDTNDTYWSGEIMLFTTLRMKDGTNLSPSPLHLIKSDRVENNQKRHMTTGTDPLETQGVDFMEYYKYDKFLAISSNKPNDNAVAKHRPTLRITLPTNTDIVDSVCLWSTKINPTFEIDRRKWDDTQEGIAKYYANNDLPNQPFYLVKEIPLTEFNGDSIEIELTTLLLNDAIHKPVYTPINYKTLSSSALLDYNNALHYAGYTYDLPTPFHISDSNLTINDVGYSSNSMRCSEVVQVKTSNLKHTVVSSSDKNSIGYLNPGSPFYRIISYPDYRAYRYEAEAHFDVSLNEAVAINMAWHHQAHTSNEKFPPIVIDNRVLGGDEVLIDTRRVNCLNQIQVSAPNNCFNLPFDNNYAVGSSSNRIIALNSPAMEMHEMKIGELPVYAFTEEGIFALQAGSGTLYASVVPVNHDRIINPNTLAINNSIVYATERGIHLLRGATNTIISEPLHRNGVVPIGEYKTCQFIHPKGFNEIVVLPTSGNIAYVYNLDMGYWSTRTLSGVKLNTDELYDDGTLYDLTNEDEDGTLPINIMTRPIKLGTLEYKRVETLIPRMILSSYGSDITVRLTTSIATNALREYTVNSPSSLPLVFRRTRDSSSYFRVQVTTNGYELKSSEFSITNIDFEWYERFRRRMR